MPSFDSDSKASNGVYIPPHMRPGYNTSLNNVPKFVDRNLKSTDAGSQKSFKCDKVTDMEGGLFSKFYVPPAKRNHDVIGAPKYFDRQFKGNPIEYKKKLQESTTVYVGNLNLVSTESDILQLFGKAGEIKTITMGVEKKTFVPAGFCFIEFKTRFGTENCMNMMQNTLLDGKNLMIDWDTGFVEGRQYARKKKNVGKSQVSISKGYIHYKEYSFQG